MYFLTRYGVKQSKVVAFRTDVDPEKLPRLSVDSDAFFKEVVSSSSLKGQ